MSDLELRDEPYEGPSAQQLTRAVQDEYVVLYGSPDDTPVDAAEFTPPAGAFVVGYLDGTPVAMGGIRRVDESTVEVKRMYVVPAARGRGLSRVVLARLEELATELGAARVVLETGARQPEAMRLYESSGYRRIPAFGHYCGSDLSVSYGKTLLRRAVG